MELSDYIIIVLVFIIIYLLYNKYIENFSISTPILLPQKINNVFKVDMSGIRKLRPIINAFDSTTTKSISLKDYKVSELVINNSEFINTSSIENLNLEGDLYIKDYTNINLCPRGVIVAWANINIPNGWLLCDGSTWWISKLPSLSDISTEPSIDNIINYDKILLPDLRAKFILNTFEYKNNQYEYGGEEQVTLNFTDMPSHKHYNSKLLVKNESGTSYYDTYKDLAKNNTHKYPVRTESKAPYAKISYDNDSSDGNDDEYMLSAMYIFPNNPYNSFEEKNSKKVYTNTGDLNIKVNYIDNNQRHGDMPHNNMPPYYSLIYIMKK